MYTSIDANGKVHQKVRGYCVLAYREGGKAGNTPTPTWEVTSLDFLPLLFYEILNE